MWGAIIQGICTILAAGIAGGAALWAVRNWKREAPGRRRIQLAEDCLITVRKILDTAMTLAFHTKFLIEEMKEDPRSTQSDDARLSIIRSRREVSGMMNEFYNFVSILEVFGINIEAARSALNLRVREIVSASELVAECDLSVDLRPRAKEAERLLGIDDGRAADERNKIWALVIKEVRPIMEPGLG